MGDGAPGDVALEPTGGAIIPPCILDDGFAVGNLTHSPSGVTSAGERAASALGMVDNGWLDVARAIDVIDIDEAMILPMA